MGFLFGIALLHLDWIERIKSSVRVIELERFAKQQPELPEQPRRCCLRERITPATTRLTLYGIGRCVGLNLPEPKDIAAWPPLHEG